MVSKLYQLRWVIIAPQAEVLKWTRAFKAYDPLIRLEEGPLVKSPHTVDILLLWNQPKESLKPFTGVKLYYSLGAGVDHLMRSKALLEETPICRIIDPRLSFSMSNYILFAVLYYQRKWAKYLQDQTQKVWDHDTPPERDIIIGILGLGTLGSDAAKKLSALGFKVLGYSPSIKAIQGVKTFSEGEMTAFLGACNVLVCTLPLTPQTEGLLSKKLFAKLQPSTYLINVARGKIHVEKDILEALETGQLSGAFLDVFEKEPLPQQSPLWTHPRVQITPHIASITQPEAGVKQVLKNVKALIEGKTLTNTVNTKKGY
ncbi:MAG: 2-hydroxyacid dehydrogenase [Flavobacteriaceae bacterium]